MASHNTHNLTTANTTTSTVRFIEMILHSIVSVSQSEYTRTAYIVSSCNNKTRTS